MGDPPRFLLDLPLTDLSGWWPPTLAVWTGFLAAL
jgi:hypothetical protein